MTVNDRADITWAPRVSLAKIWALYLKESSGICDDELIDEVGISLYLRCLSILEYNQAVAGSARCKRCAKRGITTFIERKTLKPTELIRCPNCSWQVRWRVYVAEADKAGGGLHAGNAGAAFQKYMLTYPHCKEARDKILAIDQLIHEFHWNLVHESEALEPHKPAGVNLLQGSSTQVKELLDELAYGENSDPKLLANRRWWRSQKPIQRSLRNRP